MTTMTAHPTTLSKGPRRGGSRSVDRRRAVGVPVMLHQHLELAEPAYDLWVDGRLLEELGIPDDRRTRVEIIGGEIVVSPAPYFRHAAIATQIQEAFLQPRLANPDFPWRLVQAINFN